MHKHEKKSEPVAAAMPPTPPPATPEGAYAPAPAAPDAGAAPPEAVGASPVGAAATPPPPDAKHGGHHAHAESRKESETRKEHEGKELNDKYLRLRADFDNFRKRMQREQADVFTRANQDLMLDLLPILDHLDLAVRSAIAHDAAGSYAKGFQMVADQLRAVLGKFGLQPFDAVGEPFDPAVHEAVSVQPSAETPANSVLAQARRGYRLGDRLLRPAQVVVSGGVPAANGAAAKAESPAPAGS